MCVATERHEVAAAANKRALRLNPFLWQPFTSLCNYGHEANPDEFYKFDNTDIFQTCQESFNSNSSFIFVGCDVPADFSLTESDGDPNRSYSIYATPVMDQHQNVDDRLNVSFSSFLTRLSDCNTINCEFHSISNRFRFHMQALNTSSTLSASSVAPADLSMNESSAFVSATPFRRQFRYLSNVSPSTPSFGWLQSPIDAKLYKSSSPTWTGQQPSSESNEQSRYNRKNLRSAVTNAANRNSPITINKPAFNQSNNTTPRSQNTITGQNVRRSSRLFTSNSVKENSKTPIISKFATPRSPPRKNKQRLTAKNLSTSALNEMNSDKQPMKQQSDLDKDKIETITSAAEEIKCPPTKSCATTTTTTTTATTDQQTQSQHIPNDYILLMRKRSAEGLISLLRTLAHGYQQLSQFNFTDALQMYESIPTQHRESSWVLGQIAKLHYERRDYDRAATIFQELHTMEPHRMELMEIYSTVLWQLQRDVTLSSLAQDLKAQDKTSPITWCVLGNSFSLQKEHETAIKFFERAVQVDDEFAYSYTLLGHELITTEDLDKAMSCFRSGILKDPRHYNAWYGIGSIYAKQERYGLAEFHFKRALEIHPKCSVIMVHIGVMQFHLNKVDQALETMNEAIALDPSNPLGQYHRASMFFQTNRNHEALIELEKLKQIVPKESVVYYIVGKIHKKLGNVNLALMNFSWATDLDPKGTNNQVRDAFEPNQNTTAMNVSHDSRDDPDSDDSFEVQQADEPPVEIALNDSF